MKENINLYIVPTPIGNLEDASPRVIKTLEQVDIILCEDTRVMQDLLKALDIPFKKLVSLHKFNETSRIDYVLNLLEDGNTLALTTDRGMPVISDPGSIIIAELINHNYKVSALPGPSAFVPALVASGLDAEHFFFYGFLHGKKGDVKKTLEALKIMPYTLIFYMSPHELKEKLELLLEVLGPRKLAIAREISKMYETYYYGNLESILSEDIVMKGEFVVVVEGNQDTIDFKNLNIVNHIKMYEEEGLSQKDAMKKVAEDLGISKSDVYKKYLLEKGKIN